MAVRFSTYDFSYRKKGKWYFAPSDKGRKIGEDLKEQIEGSYTFDDFYFHLHSGGHVAAMHTHRDHRYFCRIDIENFFYRIPRNRVARALRSIGIQRAEKFSKWSTVKDPFDEFNYVIPYGFIQSPILATLVLARSSVGDFLNALPGNVARSVYMDDITLSSDDIDELGLQYAAAQEALLASNFRISLGKLQPPQTVIDVFNCDLEQGRAEVHSDRIAEFYSVPRAPESAAGFDGYCDRVAAGNSS